MALNFSDFWSPVYDLEFVSLDIVLSDLNSASSIVNNCTTWFGHFFGLQGFVTLKTTRVMFSTYISSDLSIIIDYIKMSVEDEVRRLCPQCNFSFPMP